MPEIKLNLRENLLRLFRYLSAIILNYLNQFRKKSIVNDYIHASIPKQSLYPVPYISKTTARVTNPKVICPAM
ncbi:replicative DNA helicase [Orientia tsutsugamushi]|nr:replicative DNA helicase [Orientia tsutsugamushi]